MINIYFNEEKYMIEANTSLHTFLQTHATNPLPPYYAVAVNKCFITKNSYTSTLLQEGDCIATVVPMQGG